MVYSPAWPCRTRADSVVTDRELEMVRRGANIEEAAPERFERNTTLHSEQECNFFCDKEGGGRGICDDRPYHCYGRNLAIGQQVSPKDRLQLIFAQ